MAFEIQDSLKKSFKNHERKAKSEALKKKKEYTGHYQEGKNGRITQLSSKQVSKTEKTFEKKKKELYG